MERGRKVFREAATATDDATTPKGRPPSADDTRRAVVAPPCTVADLPGATLRDTCSTPEHGPRGRGVASEPSATAATAVVARRLCIVGEPCLQAASPTGRALTSVDACPAKGPCRSDGVDVGATRVTSKGRRARGEAADRASDAAVRSGLVVRHMASGSPSSGEGPDRGALGTASRVGRPPVTRTRGATTRSSAAPLRIPPGGAARRDQKG